MCAPELLTKRPIPGFQVIDKVLLRAVVGAGHADHVFTLRGRPIQAIGSSAWNAARLRVRFPQVRVHDLKHTLGRRLRAAGVSFEDRQDLLGHRSGQITTHYSAAELENLIAAAETVCGGNPHKIPTMVLLKQNAASGTAVNA